MSKKINDNDLTFDFLGTISDAPEKQNTKLETRNSKQTRNTKLETIEETGDRRLETGENSQESRVESQDSDLSCQTDPKQSVGEEFTEEEADTEILRSAQDDTKETQDDNKDVQDDNKDTYDDSNDTQDDSKNVIDDSNDVVDNKDDIQDKVIDELEDSIDNVIDGVESSLNETAKKLTEIIKAGEEDIVDLDIDKEEIKTPKKRGRKKKVKEDFKTQDIDDIKIYINGETTNRQETGDKRLETRDAEIATATLSPSNDNIDSVIASKEAESLEAKQSENEIENGELGIEGKESKEGDLSCQTDPKQSVGEESSEEETATEILRSAQDDSKDTQDDKKEVQDDSNIAQNETKQKINIIERKKLRDGAIRQTYHLDPELVEKVKLLAYIERLGISEVVNAALEEYLADKNLEI